MDKRPFFTFLVFLAISTALWLLIKLSEDYTTQTTFRVALQDVPAEKWVDTPEQTVNFYMNVDGFHTLKNNMIRESKRIVDISLNEVPYRHEKDHTYSFSSQYVAEQVVLINYGWRFHVPHRHPHYKLLQSLHQVTL